MTRLAATLCACALVAPTAASGAPRVEADVSSPRTSVGRPFDYVVRVALDSEDEALRARILAPIGAFDAVGPATTVRDGRDVRLTQRLACLGPGCVPRGDARVVALPPPRVVVDGTPTAGPPASIALVPRVPAAVVAARHATYLRQTEMPPPGFSPRPEVLAALATGISVVLVLAAVALVATGLPRRSRDAEVDADAYDRAVRLLRESATRPGPDRRRAAGFLGRVARSRAREGLSSTADRVAWSRPQPDAAAVGGLADRADQERS